jgi:hypothetical protein
VIEIQSLYCQSCEIEDLTNDYIDFLQHLKAQNNSEVPPLNEFAIWRNQEFEARDEFTNPIPAIH